MENNDNVVIDINNNETNDPDQNFVEIDTELLDAWNYEPKLKHHDMFVPRQMVPVFNGTLSELFSNSDNRSIWVYDKDGSEKKEVAKEIHNNGNTKLSIHEIKDDLALMIKGATIVAHFNNTGLNWGLESNVFDPNSYCDMRHTCFTITNGGNSRSIDNVPLNYHYNSKFIIDPKYGDDQVRMASYLKHLNIDTIKDDLGIGGDFEPIYYIKIDSKLYDTIMESGIYTNEEMKSFKVLDKGLKIGNKEQLNKIIRILKKKKCELPICEENLTFKIVPLFTEQDIKNHKFCVDPETNKYSEDLYKEFLNEKFTIYVEIIISSKYI